MSHGVEQSQWMTLAQVAQRWNVSYDTINREVNAGSIPVLKIRSERRISIKVVERIEAEGEQIVKRNSRLAKRAAFASVGKDFFPDC